MWSVLPVKLKGGGPNVVIDYMEQDDKDFLDRFFKYQNAPDPYFDPFSREWLHSTYAHSSIATMRKNRFMRAWNACEWKDNRLQLAADYPDIVRAKVLTKARTVSRIPALPLAVWFYKRPLVEWPGRRDLTDGVPSDAADLVALFRKDFNFEADTEWSALFDPDSRRLERYGRG